MTTAYNMSDPNVLLIVLDSVRARNTSLHGYARRTTPFLEEFAEDATVYTQAKAPADYSYPSHVSLFTGYHAAEHGIGSRDWRLAPGHSIWESLQEDGYATGVFSHNAYLCDPSFGLERGFESVQSGPPTTDDLPFPGAMDHRETDPRSIGGYLAETLTHQYPLHSLVNGVAIVTPTSYLPPEYEARRGRQGDAYVEYFLRWQREQSGPWAACLNLMDAHAPYDPDSEFDQWGDEMGRKHSEKRDRWEYFVDESPWSALKRLEPLYDGAIRQTDHYVESVVKTLEERAVLDDTLIVVTSDHGEGFGEPSLVRDGIRLNDHGLGIHEVIAHVPLIVKHPGQTTNRIVDEPATLTSFPSAVEAVRNGDNPTSAFVPESPVITASTNLDNNPDKLEKIKDRGIADVARFSDWAHAVYIEENEQLRKYVKWGDDEATLRIEGTRPPFKLSSTGGDRVDAVLEGLVDASCLIDNEDHVTESTIANLEELGYL